MTIDMFEFQIHFDKYLKLSRSEDIFISSCGKIIAKLTNPYHVHADEKPYIPEVPAPEPINYDRLLE